MLYGLVMRHLSGAERQRDELFYCCALLSVFAPSRFDLFDLLLSFTQILLYSLSFCCKSFIRMSYCLLALSFHSFLCRFPLFAALVPARSVLLLPLCDASPTPIRLFASVCVTGGTLLNSGSPLLKFRVPEVSSPLGGHSVPRVSSPRACSTSESSGAPLRAPAPFVCFGSI